MDCTRKHFSNIQPDDEGLTPVSLMLMEAVDKICSLPGRSMIRFRCMLLHMGHPGRQHMESRSVGSNPYRHGYGTN